MPLPTINDIQAVDPVMTNLLRGYLQDDSRFIASRIFPLVQTEKDSGTYYIYDKKYWLLDEMEERAPGQEFARVGFGVSTDTFKTLQWAIDYAIPDEIRANNQTPMSLEDAGLRLLSQRSLIRKERAFSSDFMKTSVWGTDNSSNTDWDDFAAGDPVKDVLLAVRTISQNTGQMANTMALGHIVHNALVNHPDIIDRIKFTQAGTLGNVNAALADVFGLENYWVSLASYNTANAGQAFSGSAIIDDDALVAFVAPNPGIMTASAGFTFAWSGGGSQGAISQYRDNSRKSDVLQHQEQWDQKAVSTDVGYFFSDVV